MRVQLDLEDEALSASDRKKLMKQEARILAEHGKAWLGPLAAFTVDVDVRDRHTDTELDRTADPPVYLSEGDGE